MHLVHSISLRYCYIERVKDRQHGASQRCCSPSIIFVVSYPPHQHRQSTASGEVSAQQQALCSSRPWREDCYLVLSHSRPV